MDNRSVFVQNTVALETENKKNGNMLYFSTFGDKGRIFTVFMYLQSRYVPTSGRHKGRDSFPVFVSEKNGRRFRGYGRYLDIKTKNGLAKGYSVRFYSGNVVYTLLVYDTPFTVSKGRREGMHGFPVRVLSSYVQRSGGNYNRGGYNNYNRGGYNNYNRGGYNNYNRGGYNNYDRGYGNYNRAFGYN